MVHVPTPAASGRSRKTTPPERGASGRPSRAPAHGRDAGPVTLFRPGGPAPRAGHGGRALGGLAAVFAGALVGRAVGGGVARAVGRAVTRAVGRAVGRGVVTTATGRGDALRWSVAGGGTGCAGSVPDGVADASGPAVTEGSVVGDGGADGVASGLGGGSVGAGIVGVVAGRAGVMAAGVGAMARSGVADGDREAAVRWSGSRPPIPRATDARTRFTNPRATTRRAR